SKVTTVLELALVSVTLLASVLPSWFWSPANVAVAVQPLATVTLVQSPEGTTACDWFNPPTPVTCAVAVTAVPRYTYGPASKVTTVLELALSIVKFFEPVELVWFASPA